MPNRVMWLTGTLDPAGAHGGPVLTTPSVSQSPGAVGSCSWETVPELLEDKGVSWKVYQPVNGSVGSLGEGQPGHRVQRPVVLQAYC